MTQRDPNTLDLTQQAICLADDLRFSPVHQRGELVYQIEIPSLHRFFRVGYEEYVLLSLLDGKTTVPQACGLAAARLGPAAPTTADAVTIAKWLLKNDLAHLATEPKPNRRILERDNHPSAVPSWLQRINPFWVRIPIPQSTQWMKKCTQWIGSMFSPLAVLAGVALIVVALCLAILHRAELAVQSEDFFLPSFWIGMIVIWVLLKIIHEMAHAMVCNRLGNEVKEAGIVFLLFAPLAYVDVSSCWRMKSRWSRFAVAAAGMYAELVIAAVAMVLWTMTDSVAVRYVLVQIMAAAGLSTVVFNANVLMRFDGYYILADAIDVPNLYSESSLALRSLLSRVVTGRQTQDRQLGTWRRHFVLGYGLAAFLWRILVCISLFIAASNMLEGVGILLAILGVVLWTAPPIRLLLRFFQSQLQSGVIAAIRPITVSVVLIAMAVSVLFLIKIPTAISVPSIVEYMPDTTLRSSSSGFIRQLHVHDGDFVCKGDRLLELENQELVHRRHALELTKQQTEIRLRQAMETLRNSEQVVLRKNLQSLIEQIQSVQSQVQSLLVIAPRDGQVIAPTLAQRVGGFVEEGAVLLVLSNPTDKHLIAVIDQDSLDEARQWIGREVQVRSVGYSGMAGILQRIEPRASDLLPSLSMAATEGGSLAVRQVEEGTDRDSVRLILPAFRGRVNLSPEACAALPAGLRLTTVLGYRSETLATRWQQTIDEIWYRARRVE